MDQDLLRGDLLNLTCVAEGNGSVSIMWKRDGVLLSNGAVMENSVVFPEAMPTHAGTYECVASNGDGDTSAEAMVTVSCESPKLSPLPAISCPDCLIWCVHTMSRLSVLPSMWPCQRRLFVC